MNGAVLSHDHNSVTIITAYANAAGTAMMINSAYTLDGTTILQEETTLDIGGSIPYTPLDFKFTDTYGLFAIQNSLDSNYYMAISALDNIVPAAATVSEPIGIEIRDYSTGPDYAKIYYSSESDTAGEYTLTQVVVDTSFNVISMTEHDIGLNCADRIHANGQIVVLSCPDAQAGLVSIYSEDMTLYIDIESDEDYHTLASISAITSSDYAHLIAFTAFDGDDQGIITLVNVLIDRADPTLFEAQHIESLLGDGDDSIIPNFGTIDNDNRLYIGHTNDDTNHTGSVYVIQVCMYNQILDISNPSLPACTDLADDEFAYSVQDLTASDCTDYDDSDAFIRIIAESICDFGCADYEFGQDCETCSVYMDRVGEMADYDYIFDDSEADVCTQIEDPEGCAAQTTCLDCFRAGMMCDFDFDDMECSYMTDDEDDDDSDSLGSDDDDDDEDDDDEDDDDEELETVTFSQAFDL